MVEILREPPVGDVIAGERDIGNLSADHLDGDAVAFEDAIVELAVLHFPGVDQFPVQDIKLHASEHVGALVEGRGVRGQGAAYLAFGMGDLMADHIDKEVDAFLGCHFPEVIPEGEDDSCTTVHAPEQEAHAVLGGLGEP